MPDAISETVLDPFSIYHVVFSVVSDIFFDVGIGIVFYIVSVTTSDDEFFDRVSWEGKNRHWRVLYIPFEQIEDNDRE